MKFKNLSLIAGAIALSLTAVPFSVKAETTSQAPARLAQAQAQPKQPAQGGIQLTPQQQTKIEQIRGNVRKQIEGVLTKDQRTQIKTAMEAGKPAREAFGALKFSPQQQTQLQQIMVSSQQQMEAVLTADQKAELARLREQNSLPAASGSKK
ncbi:MAG: Spy/CpxP family protein refolding chaperone [Tolypothrix sp. Co-bin9]|nr:Spy/CpxP family protein refolding chaperone [Tolypothrix sp. Co-bin9]